MRESLHWLKGLIQNRFREQGFTEVLFLLCLCLLPLSLEAQEIPVIHCDLKSCIETAFSNHPILKVADARQSTAQALLEMRMAEHKPNLDMESRIGYFSGESITPFAVVSGFTEERIRQRDIVGGYYQAKARIQVPIVKEGTLLGQTSGAVRQARFGLLKEKSKNQSLRTQVAINVTEAYINTLKNLKAIEIHEKIVASLEEDYKSALVQFNQNIISRNDLLIAEVRLAMTKRDLSLSRLTLQRSQKALSFSMGVDKVYRIDIEDLQDPPSPVPPLEKLVALARENHPGVKARQFKVRETVEETGRAQSERYPTLSLMAHYGIADNFDRPFNNQWVGVLKVEVPIFDFGLIRKKVVFARAKVMEEEKHLLDFKLNIEQEIHDLYFQIQEIENQAELIKKQIEQTTEALKLNRAMFQQGLLPQSVVHDTEAALLKLELSQINAEYDRKLTHFRLSWVSGGRDIEEQ